MAISAAEGSRVSRLANTVTSMVHPSSRSVDLLKTILNYAIASEKKYNEKAFPSCIVSIVND